MLVADLVAEHAGGGTVARGIREVVARYSQ